MMDELTPERREQLIDAVLADVTKNSPDVSDSPMFAAMHQSMLDKARPNIAAAVDVILAELGFQVREPQPHQPAHCLDYNGEAWCSLTLPHDGVDHLYNAQLVHTTNPYVAALVLPLAP